MQKKNKVAVFFSSGLGNALLLVPLIKDLRRDGYEVEGIFTSACEDLFWDRTLLAQKHVLRSWKDYLRVLLLFKRYHRVYLDFFAVTHKHLWVSAWLGKKTVAHVKKDYLQAFVAKLGVQWVDTPKDLHMILLNKKLYLSESSFMLEEMRMDLPSQKIEIPFQRYIVLQLSSGNNQAPYKTWPVERWLEVMSRFIQERPNVGIVLLGDTHEKHLVDGLVLPDRVYNLIAKTSLSEAAAVIAGAEFFVGHDSGLMHLAVAVGRPTRTVWGGSDQRLYGYAIFDSTLHRVLSLQKSCWPCNSWINPNISRVVIPLDCPDHRCLKEISVDQVYALLL